MARYINADILEASGWIMSRTRPESGTAAMVQEIKKPTDFPSADVRENVRGKWIDVDPYGDSGLAFKCSECDKNSIRDTNYCPNCGADMRG